MSEIKVRRGGKIVRVTENELEKYLGKGYVIYEQPVSVEPEAPRKTVSETQPKAKVEPVVAQTTKRRNKK